MKIDGVTISAICYTTEDPEKVAKAIGTLVPFEFQIGVTNATGHYGNPIKFFEIGLRKKREIKQFWNHLMERLGDQRKIVLEFLDDLIDEEGVLHLRIDKQSAFLGNIEFSSGGDSVMVRVKLVTYPFRRDKILEFAEKLISQGYD